MKRRYEDFIAAEEERSGCRIYLEFERRLSGSAARIEYHNPNVRTLKVNLTHPGQVCPFGCKSGLSSIYARIYEEYCFQYIAAGVRLDQWSPVVMIDSYLEGLALLWRHMIKKMDHMTTVTWLRTRTFLLKPCWTPDELFCDVMAIMKTEEVFRGTDMNKNIKAAIQEAALLIRMPEIFYPKKKMPCLSAPYIIQKLNELNQTDTLQELIKLGGVFAEGMILRIAAGGMGNILENNSITEAFLPLSAADLYRQQAAEWLQDSTVSSSHIINENRIGVERTVNQINELMNEITGFGNSGTVHPLGYY